MSRLTKIIIALAAGVLAGIVAQGYLFTQRQQLISMAQPTAVVVATREIMRGEAITEDALMVLEIPSAYVQPDTTSTVSEVVGRRAIVRILEAEQITRSKVVAEAGTRLSTTLPVGLRAVTLAVTDQAAVNVVAGLLEPGDYVDVVGVFKLGESTMDAKSEAHVILQAQLVVAIDQFTGQQRVPILENGQVLDEGLIPTSVTLAISPEDAQRLILAQSIGDLYLMLRSERDSDEQITFTGLDAQRLLGVEMPIWTPAKEEAEARSEFLRSVR